MGSSPPHYIIELFEIITKQKPTRILDLGVGFGKNGMLCREYSDIWGSQRYEKGKWQVKIDGVEIYENYIAPHSKYLYNDIYIGNIVDVLPSLDKYNFIIMSDVLEHFTKDDGYKLMDLIISKSDYYMITIPTEVGNRMRKDNPNQSHISGEWSVEELSRWGNVKVRDGVFILTSKKLNIK